MKKYLAILVSLAFVFTSCEKSFEVTNSSSLSGSQAAAMVEEDPGFLTSYVNGFYAWMVAYGGSHDNFGHLGCLYNLDMMGLDIAICGTWNWGTFDINHDFGQYDYRRPYQFWNFYYTLIKKCNEVIDFFGAEDPINPDSARLSRTVLCPPRNELLLPHPDFPGSGGRYHSKRKIQV